MNARDDKNRSENRALCIANAKKIVLLAKSV